MIEISWDESRLNSFYKKMDNIIKNLATHAEDGVEQASEETRKHALNLKRGSKSDSLILKEVTKSAQQAVGRIYTNFKYAGFLEYGTGTKAEMPHIGHTKTFIESGFKYWFLPVDKVEKALNNQVINIDGNLFYLMFATQPYPFMRPTAFGRRDENVKVVKEKIQEGILRDIR